MSTHDIILLGAGGHARMLQVFLSREGHRVLGCISPAPADSKTDPCDLPWMGDDDWLAAQSDGGELLVNGIGSVSTTKNRRYAFRTAHATGRRFLNYCHPSAIVDARTSTGTGLQVLAGAIVQPGCLIGDNVLVNTAAVLEHDVVLADHVHVAPRACICGGARISEGAHIGAGALVMQDCKIGHNAVVGAGAVVVRDVPAGETVVGIPARLVTRRKRYD